MSRMGFKIIAIVEWDGAVYNANGLDIEELMAHRRETGSIVDFPEGENMDREAGSVSRMRRPAAGRERERDHFAQCASSPRDAFFAKARTDRRQPLPMRFWQKRKSSSFRTSWRTPAA